jgi:hypothetical protein
MDVVDDATLRDRMVDRLLSGGGCCARDRSPTALRARPPAPVPARRRAGDRAYEDEAIPTRWSTDGRPTSSSSQPAIVAAMLEQLGVRPGDRVLEIGSGTGWNAGAAGPAGRRGTAR